MVDCLDEAGLLCIERLELGAVVKNRNLISYFWAIEKLLIIRINWYRNAPPEISMSMDLRLAIESYREKRLPPRLQFMTW